MSDQPPKWAGKLLQWICSHEQLEILQGDLAELFQCRLRKYGSTRAKLHYIKDVLDMLRPFAIRKRKPQLKMNHFTMYKNYLKVAFRVFSKQKLITLINTISLTIGIASISLIYFFIVDEYSFDGFHPNKDNIYRFTSTSVDPGGAVIKKTSYMPIPLGPTVVADFPEITNFTRILQPRDYYVRVGNEVNKELVSFADSSFFQMFSFPLIHGDKNQVFHNPNSMVLTEKMALKYFNTTDVVGKLVSVRFGNKFQEYLVSGVAQNTPKNSSVRFQFILPYSSLPSYRRYKTYWGAGLNETYVVVNKTTDLPMLEEKLEVLWTRYMSDVVAELKEDGEVHPSYELQPLSEVHLNPNISGMTKTSDSKYSYILGGIGFLIFFIACANFMILAIGRSAGRGKEVGIRKLVGARRRHLILQFWAEAILISMFSLGLGVVLIYFVLPYFNELSNKSFDYISLFTFKASITLIGIAIVGGLLAGLYPAVTISSLKTTSALKKRIRLGGVNLFTKSLVTSQFAVSILLIIGTLVMWQQVNFIKDKDLGYQSENVIVIPNELQQKDIHQFKNALNASPHITSFSLTSYSLTREKIEGSFSYEGIDIPYYMFRVGSDYFPTLEIDFLEGRDFDPLISSDSVSSIIVNKEFARRLGPDFKVGDKLEGFRNFGVREPSVIAIIEDFNLESLTESIKPAIFTIRRLFGFEDLLVKISSDQTQESLTYMRNQWETIAPEIPFSYSFLNEDVSQQYVSEEKWTKIVQYSSILTISIALLGLLGLIMLTVNGRIKEMGIRKVLGARSRQLFFLLFRQFNVLILIATVIAVPLAIYVLEKWLVNFAYRVSINPFTLMATIAIIFCITMLVVGINTIKARSTNPVDSLRQE